MNTSPVTPPGRLLARALLLFLLGGLPALKAQVTEFPTTVQPGRFLLEVDALSLTFDREPGGQYTGIGAATTFLTTGLTRQLDLQVGAEFFITQKFDANGLTDRQSGFGDIYVRAKWRFYESEDTYTAVAVMPYIKFPTNSGGVGNDAVEGGIIVPMSTELVGGFHLAAMGELAYRRNDTDDGYDAYWLAAASVSRQVAKILGLYGEVVAAKSSGAGSWEGTLGVGATLHFSKHAWWDVASYRGISKQAPDWTHVLRYNLGF